MNSRRLLLSFFVAASVLLFLTPGHAQSDRPTAASAPHKRAVIIIGPDGMLAAKESLAITRLLEDHDYAVEQFVGRRATWEQIKPAIDGADLLIYSGHGSTAGYDNVGGLCLAGNEIVSMLALVDDVSLAPGALVVFKSVCYGAGSSASDRRDIGTEEAARRVEAYSRPFFEMGASAYFADNYNGSTRQFLELLFSGHTLQSAFETLADPWTTIEFDRTLPTAPSMRFGIASSQHSGYHTVITTTNGITKRERRKNFKTYDVAYAGLANFTLGTKPSH